MAGAMLGWTSMDGYGWLDEDRLTGSLHLHKADGFVPPSAYVMRSVPTLNVNACRDKVKSLFQVYV